MTPYVPSLAGCPARRQQAAVHSPVALLVLLLEEGAAWDLPLGLRFWGYWEERLFLAQGWEVAPKVPASALRQAAQVGEEEIGLLSPARLWCVPRTAFLPLRDALVLERRPKPAHLVLEGVPAPLHIEVPPVEWEVEAEEAEAGPEIPIQIVGGEAGAKVDETSRLLEEARRAAAGGDHIKAGQLYERAGSFALAAGEYDLAIERESA